MLSLINWRLKVTLNDGRALTGQMLAFDRHMNLVLADCEEFRRVRAKKKAGEEGPAPEQEIKRTLGLVILRGEAVVSLSVEGPPPVQDEDKKAPGVRISALFPSRGHPCHTLRELDLICRLFFSLLLYRARSFLVLVVECLLDEAWE